MVGVGSVEISVRIERWTNLAPALAGIDGFANCLWSFEFLEDEPAAAVVRVVEVGEFTAATGAEALGLAIIFVSAGAGGPDEPLASVVSFTSGNMPSCTTMRSAGRSLSEDSST